jgi:hypothetical protein
MTLLRAKNVTKLRLVGIRFCRLRWRFHFGIAVALQWLQTDRSRAENHLDCRYECCKEEVGGIKVETHAALFEAQLMETLGGEGALVYDSVSGMGMATNVTGLDKLVQFIDTSTAANAQLFRRLLFP